MDDTGEAGHYVPHEIVQIVVGREGVYAKETSVLVTGVEGGDGVGELVLGNFLAHFGGHVLVKAGGAVVGTEHGIHENEGEGILGGPKVTLEGKADVGGVIGIEADANVRASEEGRIEGGVDRVGRGGGEVAKML